MSERRRLMALRRLVYERLWALPVGSAREIAERVVFRSGSDAYEVEGMVLKQAEAFDLLAGAA